MEICEIVLLIPKMLYYLIYSKHDIVYKPKSTHSLWIDIQSAQGFLLVSYIFV